MFGGELYAEGSVNVFMLVIRGKNVLLLHWKVRGGNKRSGSMQSHYKCWGPSPSAQQWKHRDHVQKGHSWHFPEADASIRHRHFLGCLCITLKSLV